MLTKEMKQVALGRIAKDGLSDYLTELATQFEGILNGLAEEYDSDLQFDLSIIEPRDE